MKEATNPAFVFEIPGHRVRYHLTALLPYYGTTFCERFAAAWKRAGMFETGETSQNYFKTCRTAFKWIALRGLTPGHSTERTIHQGYQNGVKWAPVLSDWKQVIINLSGSILDMEDNSFIESTNVSSRNKKLESLRSGLRWLSDSYLFPAVDPQGRLEDRGSSPSPCLATLSFAAGRLDVSGLNPSEASEAFVQRNRDMLEEIRRCLVAELEQNVEKFVAGQRMLADSSVPTISEVYSYAESRLV